jgi:hypothetical protein
MRPSRSLPRTSTRLATGLLIGLALSAGATLLAQIPGRNVNMVAGTGWPDGDPFLQRQNEPTMAASTRNPLHLLGGSNDYRTVDLPGLLDDAETGDAWISVYKSFDGGQRWSSTLLPGYPQDASPAGLASPLKGYQAGADPVVRAGTHGLLYYSGLVFDRGEGGKSGIFLARFIDTNAKENGDPVSYLGASMVASSTGLQFLDKPWMAVDIPRGNNPVMCVVGGTPDGAKVKRNGHRNGRGNSTNVIDDGLIRVPGGAVYVAYTSITGDGDTLRAEIFLKRSLDCGATWSAPMRVTSSADFINQGAVIAIDPQDGDVFVAWRRFASPAQPGADAVMLARLPAGGGTFSQPGKARAFAGTGSPSAALEKIFEHRKKREQPSVVAAVSNPDQGTSPYSFRTNAYPAMAIDGSSRVYVAWSERGFAVERPSPVDGDARIRVATTTDAVSFTAPVTAANETLGHQVMPSLAFAGGKLMLVYYDLRDTAAQIFGKYITDQGLTVKRQTIDIRASLGTIGPTPAFAPSVKVSDYLTGYRSNTTVLEQLQINPPNLPMFKLGTVPFIGDYIDLTPTPAFVPAGGGRWVYNTAASASVPLFHTTWTDNRDVRAPLDGNWANYTPPTIVGGTGESLFDPSQTVAVCHAGNAGSRNQNIYTARISGGLLVAAPGNSKQLSTTLQRGFVVFATNETTTTKIFRMTVLAQPVGGRASFEQFPLPPYTASSPAPRIVLDVSVPGRSTASRTLYVTSSDPKAQVFVSVTQVAAVGGDPVPGGLSDRVIINPDIDNPDIDNPDIDNPDIDNPDIDNAEVYNPDIDNPDIDNPDIDNPDIDNPDIDNPDIDNVRVANPDIDNVGVGNPDIDNPDIDNPDIDNPDIDNPDIDNGSISDVTWTVSNIGNTTAAFNVNLFLATAGVPAGITPQLVVYKTYKTPVLALNGCDLRTETRNVLMFNVNNPTFITSGAVPDQNDPSDKNATLWLAPGELGRVTLRLYDDNKFDNVIVTNLDGSHASIDPRFNPATAVTLGVSAQGVDVLDPPGTIEPPVITTTGSNLFFIQQPTTADVGSSITPAVSVRVFDNTGAPLSGVSVSMSLLNPPVGVVLSGTVSALTSVDGVATFATLAVNAPATGLRLRATAAFPGGVAAGTSEPFDVGITPPTNLFFITQPTAAAVGAPITPPVRVRVLDDSGAVIPGVFVNMSLLSPPVGVALTGTVNAVAGVDGIATFANLAVSAPAAGLRLRAQATFPGGAETGTSDPFDVGSLPASVAITNYSFIYDGLPKSVTVSTDPPELSVAVTYDGSATVPSAIGANLVVATVDEPGYSGSRSVVQTIATTLSVGGSGGNPYGLLSCSPGVYANGISPSTNGYYGLLGAQLLCSDSNHPARFAGPLPEGQPAYTETALSCSPGEVVVGIHGMTGAPFDYSVVETVGVYCRPIGGGEVSIVGAAGGGFYPDTEFSLTCPAGQAVTGVVGGVGEVVDSIALVCSSTPVLSSASPSTLAEFQYVTLTGTNLPATLMGDVLFSQGGPELASDFLWSASPSLVVARVPPGLVVDGPTTTVRLKNADDTVTTNSVPVTIASTPGAPVLLTIYNSTEVPAATTMLGEGQQFMIEADGTGSSGTTFRWLQGDTLISQAASFTMGGPTGRVGTVGTVPPGVTSGAWTLFVTQDSSGFSNGIAVTVVVP